MTPRRPERIWWTWTFIVGVFSPGQGKRRINTKMQELYQENRVALQSNSDLTSQIKFLRGELRRVQGENNAFLLQDEMNSAIPEPSFAPPNLPVSSDAEAPRPLRWTTKQWPKVS